MKQCSKSENVLIIDSDYEEADGFIKGVREVTGEEWQVALHENNKIYGWRRYVRFFTVALQTVLSGKKYEGKTVLCWQQFYGIAIAFFQRMFHMKKRYKLVIMTFIYKEKRGLAGKLFYRFVRYAVTSRYMENLKSSFRITQWNILSPSRRRSKNRWYFVVCGRLNIQMLWKW